MDREVKRLAIWAMLFDHGNDTGAGAKVAMNRSIDDGRRRCRHRVV